MNQDEFFNLLGQFSSWIISGAAGALLLRFWGSKWIENILSKDLEAFKAQKLHEFDLLLTRKVKWHEKEHEILSLSWVKIINAYNALKRSTGLLRELPNIDGMTDLDLQKFIKRSDFSEEESDYLRSESKKNSAYIRILDIRALKEAHKLFYEFHEYFESNKIFLHADVKEKFVTIDNHLWSAWVDTKMSHDDKKLSFTIEARKTVKDKIEPLLKEIEDLIQKKLFPETA